MPTLAAALSADCFATYLQWALGDQALAERLYTYNVQLSAALYGPLHMQEVSLRNMADQALAQRYGLAWHLDPAVLADRYQRDNVTKAVQSLQQAGKAGTRPQVIVELNFGFWSSLFGRQSHHLWQTLRPIYQARGIQRGAVAQNLRELRLLRIRIAHYEPIIALPLAQRYANITTLTGWLSPPAAGLAVDGRTCESLAACRSPTFRMHGHGSGHGHDAQGPQTGHLLATGARSQSRLEFCMPPDISLAGAGGI